MLFMSISFASGTQRKHVFQWNMGLTIKEIRSCGSINDIGMKGDYKPLSNHGKANQSEPVQNLLNNRGDY